ncbi:MAG TPA: hypothetical protein VFW71_07275 [Actinomycetota bacterium]|nr:hypothetical protein [Actinomycetota bacterium]
MLLVGCGGTALCPELSQDLQRSEVGLGLGDDAGGGQIGLAARPEGG